MRQISCMLKTLCFLGWSTSVEGWGLSFRLRLVVWLTSYIKITTERNAWFSKVGCMHPLIATITLSEVISLRIFGQVISHMSLGQFCKWHYRSKKNLFSVSWRATTSCKDGYQGLEEIRQHQIQLQHSLFDFNCVVHIAKVINIFNIFTMSSAEGRFDIWKDKSLSNFFGLVSDHYQASSITQRITPVSRHKFDSS